MKTLNRNNDAVIRKNHRLPGDSYIGKRICFVTIGTDNREKIFVDKGVVGKHLEILEQAGTTHGFDTAAYCFMPDHLHLLVIGTHENSNLVSFIKNYKQITGYRHKRTTSRRLWQKSFYDHILRNEEDIKDLVRYILANPVRRHLVDRPADYPFCGSLKYGNRVFEW